MLSVEVLTDLLDYDKLQSKLMSLQLTYRDPVLFVKSSLKLFEFQALKNNIQFSLDVPRSVSEDLVGKLVHVDKVKLSQVIRNFLSNAFKFTPVNGTIIVRLAVEKLSFPPGSSQHSLISRKTKIGPEPTDWLRVDVIDNGAGIDKKNLPKLFKDVRFHVLN